MAAWPPPGVIAKHDGDEIGSAVDNEEYSLDDYGDLAAIEGRESLENKLLERYKKTMIAEREAAIRSAESVAHPIPPKVHMMIRVFDGQAKLRKQSQGVCTMPLVLCVKRL